MEPGITKDQEKVLEWIFSEGVKPKLFMGLFTKAPNKDGVGGSEVSGGGYTRQRVSFVIGGAAFKNKTRVKFPKAKKAWGHVTHFGVFDAPTGGNMLAFGRVTAWPNQSILVDKGDQFTSPAGGITVTPE